MSLTGKRILITRTRHQASSLAEGLEALGATPILIPAIEITPPTSYDSLDAAVAQLDTFDWLILTSANAVESLHTRHPNLRIAANPGTPSGTATEPGAPSSVQPGASRDEPKVGETPRKLRVAAIGPATAKVAQGIGLPVSLIPPQAVAESLAEALVPHAQGARMLLVRAEQARDHLPEALKAAGALLTIADAYRTLIPPDSVTALRSLFASRSTHPDAITFTSSSTATNLFALLESAAIHLPGEIALASIGPITSQTLRDLGHSPALEAAEATVPSLITALEIYFRKSASKLA